jgi:redox-sensitive bicupin YhaK (pirin superfamily)
MSTSNIISVQPLGFPWQTQDPFLFCAHHADHYPKGNDKMGPAVSLAGRNLGQDFTIKDGFRMYHGKEVPGFPSHPHRGFETVTIATTGLVDHSDSLGGAGRFGDGDVQWMTAGKGVQHSEMFPLRDTENDNPFELFQIWLNLPRSKKMVEPHYKMLWHEDVPVVVEKNNGKTSKIRVVAGNFKDTKALAPAPDSWASDDKNHVSIWTLELEAGAEVVLPPASAEANRTLYFYEGDEIEIAGSKTRHYHSVQVNPNAKLTLKAGNTSCYLLMLQGKPLKEPVAQYGPFVMNTQQEIQQAMMDYQRTQFGGWPWPRHDNVHPREKGRFAFQNGKEEVRG